MAESEDGSRRTLEELRVIDLRTELSKRGQDKTGVRSRLIDRLRQLLDGNGHNPDTFKFDINSKGPMDYKKRISSQSDKSDDSDDSQGLQMDIPDNHDQLYPPLQTLCDDEFESYPAVPPISPIMKDIDELEKMLAEDEFASDSNAMENYNTDTQIETPSTISDNVVHMLENAAYPPSSIEMSFNFINEERGNTTDHNTTKRNIKGTSNIPQGDEPNIFTTEKENIDETPPCTAPSDTNEKSKTNTVSKNTVGRSLWVTNLLPITRAQELKQLFSTYGRVIGAKVVQSSRTPQTRCYGYVTMETQEAANLSIKHLNNTELQGQIIRVTKVKPEHTFPLSKIKRRTQGIEITGMRIDSPPKTHITHESHYSTRDRNFQCSKTYHREFARDRDQRREKEYRPVSNRDRSYNRYERDYYRETNRFKASYRGGRNYHRSTSRNFRSERNSDILTFDKILQEREKQRHRNRERMHREQEKQQSESYRNREKDRRQSEEALRLELEFKKLRAEREDLEKRRDEVTRLARENQRLSREKNELEERLKLEFEERNRTKCISATAVSGYERHSASNYGAFMCSPSQDRFPCCSNSAVVSHKHERIVKGECSRNMYNLNINTDRYRDNWEARAPSPVNKNSDTSDGWRIESQSERCHAENSTYPENSDSEAHFQCPPHLAKSSYDPYNSNFRHY